MPSRRNKKDDGLDDFPFIAYFSVDGLLGWAIMGTGYGGGFLFPSAERRSSGRMVLDIS